jgi:hypothetical protein
MQIGHYVEPQILKSKTQLRVSNLGQTNANVAASFGAVKPSGHYMYRPVVTIYTAQWSLYVPPSGHYMYRPVVTIYTAQWSLHVSPSGHYMYRPVVTICTAQWSLYVPHSGHYMYRIVVTICTTMISISQILRSAHSLYLCVWCGSQNKQRLFPYTALTDWFV